MSEIKRGYPNPNYTDEDVVTEEEAMLEAEVGLVTVDCDHYEELVSKAAALDILTAAIKRKGEVNNDIVWAVTGADPDTVIKEMKKESAQRLDWYWDEKRKNEALEAKLSQSERARKELIEILKQNKIGPFADEQTVEEVNA